MTVADTERSAINVEGIRAVLAMIELNPDRWDQTKFLGSRHETVTYCFVSWTCHLAGLDVSDLYLQHPLRLVSESARLLGLSFETAKAIAQYPISYGEPHPTVEQLRDYLSDLIGVSLT